MMMMMESGRVGELVPFTVMVTLEGLTIGFTILAKSAMNAFGISPYVFVVYVNAVSSIILLPYSFLYHRDRVEQSLFTLPLMVRYFLLGFTGIALAQNLSFMGLYYSSPYMVCVMGLLIPTFNFILGIIRTAKLDLRSSSSRAKMVGALISIVGAVAAELYKGPFLDSSSSPSQKLQLQKQSLFVFYTTPDRWVLGGVLLAASSFCVCIWNIIQMGTARYHPQGMKVASFYSIAGTIQCAVFASFMVRDLDAWKLNSNLELLLIILTAIYASIIRSSLHVLFTKMKGSLYVPLFRPFGIIFATTFALTFFPKSLHYGSAMGAVMGGIGYYTVMWGNVRDDEISYKPAVFHSSDEKVVPLLQDQDDELQV